MHMSLEYSFWHLTGYVFLSYDYMNLILLLQSLKRVSQLFLSILLTFLLPCGILSVSVYVFIDHLNVIVWHVVVFLFPMYSVYVNALFSCLIKTVPILYFTYLSICEVILFIFTLCVFLSMIQII